MERCCSRVLELDHGGFNTTHPFGGEGSYEAFKDVRLQGCKRKLKTIAATSWCSLKSVGFMCMLCGCVSITVLDSCYIPS
jgi:hypothetical protein